MCYKNWANDTMKRIINKLEITAPQIGASFPHATKDGIYTFEGSQFWTNGFWPGILWMAYQNTKNEKYSLIRALFSWLIMYHQNKNTPRRRVFVLVE